MVHCKQLEVCDEAVIRKSCLKHNVFLYWAVQVVCIYIACQLICRVFEGGEACGYLVKAARVEPLPS